MTQVLFKCNGFLYQYQSKPSSNSDRTAPDGFLQTWLDVFLAELVSLLLSRTDLVQSVAGRSKIDTDSPAVGSSLWLGRGNTLGSDSSDPRSLRTGFGNPKRIRSLQSELCKGINKSTSCPDLAIRRGSDCHKQPRAFLAVTTELIFLLSFNLAFQFLVLFCLLLGKELGHFGLMCVLKKKKMEPLKQIGTELGRRLLIILCHHIRSMDKEP